jgi:hypothetical protein
VSKLADGIDLDAIAGAGEFSRLNIQSTVLSKRKLIQLVSVCQWAIRCRLFQVFVEVCLRCRFETLFVNVLESARLIPIYTVLEKCIRKYGRYCSLLRLETST